jgi:hypothetical protein
MRMVTTMVEQFREMQRLLGEEIENYETQEFQALDAGISEVFEAIYQHTPTDRTEAQAIIRLFLDLMANNDAGDNIRLIERVRQIIENCTDASDTPVEMTFSAGI